MYAEVDRRTLEPVANRQNDCLMDREKQEGDAEAEGVGREQQHAGRFGEHRLHPELRLLGEDPVTALEDLARRCQRAIGRTWQGPRDDA